MTARNIVLSFFATKYFARKYQKTFTKSGSLSRTASRFQIRLIFKVINRYDIIQFDSAPYNTISYFVVLEVWFFLFFQLFLRFFLFQVVRLFSFLPVAAFLLPLFLFQLLELLQIFHFDAYLHQLGFLTVLTP